MTTSKNKYNHYINIDKIMNTKSVIRQLEILNDLLANSELVQLTFFNRAYIIITEQIDKATSENLFTNTKDMTILELTFAKEYFSALNQYVNKGTLPIAWRRVNQKWFHNDKLASISLMFGANAHINYDLLPALRKSIQKPTMFRDDYFKVNKLLKESSKDISKSYYESEETINFLKKSLRPLYLRPTIWLIIRWRAKVWNNFSSNSS